jgi:hypothetical protein
MKLLGILPLAFLLLLPSSCSGHLSGSGLKAPLEEAPREPDAHIEGSEYPSGQIPTDESLHQNSLVDPDDSLVGAGVESSLRASLRGVIERSRDATEGEDTHDLRFMVCSTDYDYERKIAITNCSPVEP